ncbi:CIC family chloride channel protein [Hymenobacter luteus]|uniref:CIC family chloride channel protein n=2 Tax=Hymenobacter TaxID=89966 RepID=A0A7W9T1H6_9BACT|nr:MULTISPECIES: chloride channel protein [Hymenobacter]MBB4601690.1 CIC family chloride channel protein [Hymenobacter latericoloratus]MBB6059882.1 CIC family chloride channel protein [Hymenobacter luteus]
MAQNTIHRLLRPLLIWRRRYISDRVYLILVSMVVGLLAGLAAVLLKTLVHDTQKMLNAWVPGRYQVFTSSFYPIIGIALTVLFTRYFLDGNLGRGIGPIIYNIARQGSVVPRSKLYSQLVSSFLTVTFGGSAGLEAPISVTGSAIGSNTSRVLRIGRRERRLLTGCGAAAGVAAIFNSPIAGVLFAVEVILSELSAAYFVPLLISSATATVVSKALYAGQPFVLITTSWPVDAVPLYLMLAVFTALLSVYMIRVYFWADKYFEQLPGTFRKVLLGGLALGGLVFLFPPLYGEGYNIVQLLLGGHAEQLVNGSLFDVFQEQSVWLVLLVAAGSMLLKVVATTITIGSGGNGGMFGSSLFAGALCGFVFARLINMSGLYPISEVHFIVLGMAGTLAGVVHAPLTGIFLIAEITGGYALFVPLMVVTSGSYLITRYFEPYSVYTRKLVQKGVYVNQDRDRGLLAQLDVASLIQTDFLPVRPDDTLGELVQTFRHATRNLFPVVDAGGHLHGVVSLDTVRDALFDDEHYNTTRVRDLMSAPPAIVRPDDTLLDTLRCMEQLDAWALPVLSLDDRYLGFLLKSTILANYRRQLIKESEI